MRRALQLSVCTVVVSCVWASPARSQELESRVVTSSEAPRYELAAIASYLAPPIRGGSTPFGAGFGGRFGVSFGHVFVGASVVDYLGSTDVDLTRRSLLYGGTVGYTFEPAHAGGVTFSIRPAFGAGGLTLFYTTPNTVTTTAGTRGATTASTSTSQAGVDVVSTASGGTSSGTTSSSSYSASADNTTTVNAPYVEPSITFMVASGSTFLAATGSMLIVPSVADGEGGNTMWVTYGVQLNLGVRF